MTSIEQELARRRFGPPVRLEIENGVDEKLVEKLAEEIKINPENIIHIGAHLDLTSLNKIADLDFPALKFERFRSRTAKALSEVDQEDPDLFFAAIRQGEILLHHPYESFTSSCLLYTSPSPRDRQKSRMPSSA